MGNKRNYFNWTFKRFYWNTGIVSDGKGYSNKLSFGLVWDSHSWFVGLAYNQAFGDILVFLMIGPIGLRIHRIKSYGGLYTTQ